jgi:uncharacterized small protein (DUF1192 family)
MAMSVLTGQTVKKEISPSELSQRVAVLKRFKELLKAQRDRFHAYLNALDKQKDVIQQGTTDDLLRHVELEEKIVEDIFSIQKVIDPLEKMYQATRIETPAKTEPVSSAQRSGKPKSDGPKPDKNVDEVVSLKETLDNLKAEALIRSERNRELLAKRMAELRSEIRSLKSSAYTRPTFDNSPAPSLIDIKG